jgi:hypothetical protein
MGQAGVLVVAAGSAYWVFTRHPAAERLTPTEAIVWTARASDIQRIEFEEKLTHVTIEAREDKTGRWYWGTIDRRPPAPGEEIDDPDFPRPPPSDAGPDAAADAGPAEPPPHTITHFVSTTNGSKMADSLAPLKAVRAIGKVSQDRLPEFGLAKPEAKIVVRIAGKDHELKLGDQAPGGTDRYVLDEEKGEIFAIRSQVERDLEAADYNLIDRELHAYKDIEAKSAKIVAGGKSRDLVRGGGERANPSAPAKTFWADPASADKSDETVGNWMQKLDRLMPTEFIETLPAGAALVVRVDYKGGSAPLGFTELYKSGTGEKAEYFAKSERTRMFAKVSTPSADQIAQDVATIVR